MASPVWAEPGTGTTQLAAGLFTSLSGTVTTDAAVTIAGERSVKCNSAAGNAAAYQQKNGILSAAGNRHTFRVKITTLPTGTVGILTELDASDVVIFRFSLRSDGKLCIIANATEVSTGATVLSTGVEYQIHCCRTISSTTIHEARIYLDDASSPECTQSNGATLAAATVDRARWGWTQAPGASKVLNLGQIVVDDGATLDNPGDHRCTAKQSAAAHQQDATWFDVTTGIISARPINASSADYRVLNGAADVGIDDYTPQAANVGDTDITDKTIRGFYGWVFHQRTSGTYTGTDRIISGAVETTFVPGTTAALANEPMQVVSTYPVNIGIRRTVGNGPDIRHRAAGVVVVYDHTPPVSDASVVPFGLSRSSQLANLRRRARFPERIVV